MARLERLGAAELRQVMIRYRDALRAHQEVINRLNVYPVPDGDTGTNMLLTSEAVLAELEGAGHDLAATCRAVSRGSLMGARGNSGVILSQILRGFAGAVAPPEARAGHGASAEGTGAGGTGADTGPTRAGIDAARLVAGLGAAAEAAYQAVMRPVEGTILTVVREAAEAAAAAPGHDLVAVLEAAREAGGAALDRTPELLPVLARAGVVDAGGAGFLLLLDAALEVAAGRPLPEPPPVEAVTPAAEEAARQSAPAEGGGHGDGDVADLRYEVMYLLEAPDESIEGFKQVWATLGDSIVVVGGEGTWNCHIHTDEVGPAIEAALDVGRPRNISVTDLREQVEEERWVREGGARPDAAEPEPPVPEGCAAVAVATGDGLERIFRSLGVTRIVAGGQSMNPSTAQVLEAVASTGAPEVVVLPNNKNIVPVARQAAEHADRPVRVVPTRGIAEGFAALMAYDPDADAATNAAAMTEATAAVTTGEVTRAVRDATSDAGPIAAGDYLGLCEDGVVAVAAELAEAACGLLDRIVAEEHEIVTVIEGEGASPAVTRRISEWLAEHRPDVECEVHHGGQPLYPYLFGVE